MSPKTKSVFSLVYAFNFLFVSFFFLYCRDFSNMQIRGARLLWPRMEVLQLPWEEYVPVQGLLESQAIPFSRRLPRAHCLNLSAGKRADPDAGRPTGLPWPPPRRGAFRTLSFLGGRSGRSR